MKRSTMAATAYSTGVTEAMPAAAVVSRLFPVVAGVLWLGSASGQDAELARSQALWTTAAHENYVYAYQKYCECHRDVPPQTFVTVAAGRIERVYHVHADSDREVPAREGSLDLYWTIDDLLALIATAAERGVAYRAAYDETLGYPTLVYIDYDPAAIGEEIDIRLTSLKITD